MFLSSFTKRFVPITNIATLMPSALRFYTGVGCKGPPPCKMDSSTKKLQPLKCRPKEASCSMPVSKASVCCGTERLLKNPCSLGKAKDQDKKKDLKLEKRTDPRTAAWEYPIECCGNPCPEMLPKFDSLYYKPTDKETRKYQQTWVECPPIQIRPRKACCYEPTELPPIYRRVKLECPITACEFDKLKMKDKCDWDSNKKCTRVDLPCCLRGRYPPSCKKYTKKRDCTKKCCPYPSFSECCYECVKPLRPNECCWPYVPAQCEIFAQLRRKLMYSLPPPLPAWPPRLLGPRQN